MKQIKFSGLLAAMLLLLSSCWFLGPSLKGNGNVTEETRPVKDFSQIEVSRGMNVYITQGTPAKVTVIADNNLHEVIKTKVEGGVLKVYVEANIRWANEKKVMVTVEKLTRVESTSGSNVYTQNQMMAENLELSANSGANLTMEVDARYLKADCSSGANVNLSGLAKEAKLEGSTGANLKGQGLKVDNCKMEASTGGNVFATVAMRLDAKASTGGNVFYYGEPASIQIINSTGGNILHK